VPAVGTTLEVAPGVRWLRMALPFQLDHINLWLLRDRVDGQDGWSIVDCGITNDATRAAWEQVFANELQGLPVLRVIVTHMHPDHIGLAHWLTERWNVRLWISATDYNGARLASSATTGFGGPAAARFMASHGLTDPAAQERSRHAATISRAWCRRCRRSSAACWPTTCCRSAGTTGAATPATATRPSTCRCTAKHSAC
jgi:glyoxylase-like metal-dependent hydrolase (beta-lactamase superfamily II)